jgi:hypothetical protein
MGAGSTMDLSSQTGLDGLPIFGGTMRQGTQRALSMVRQRGTRLMDAVFGVQPAGACISPMPYCGCAGWPRGIYQCCHEDCAGNTVCTVHNPPPMVAC